MYKKVRRTESNTKEQKLVWCGGVDNFLTRGVKYGVIELRRGDRMKKILTLVSFGLSIFVFALGGNSLAYTSDQNPNLPVLSFVNPLDYLKEDLLKSAAQSTGIGTTVPSLNLLNTENLSSGDIVSALKAVAVLAINLFLIVIQTVAGILKALLPFLGK